MNTLITTNVHRRLQEPFEAASVALRRLEPMQPLRDALTALGLAQNVSVRASQVPAAAPGTATFSLAWPLAEGTNAHVTWSLSVAPFGEVDSLLSASIRAGVDSPAAEQQLLAAWPLLGQIVESHTTRMLNALTELAEHVAGSDLEQRPLELRAAA
jgi:hypothetical protein